MIWKACRGDEQIKPISGVLYRLVESQEQIATLGYVDTLAEQAVLEELLDGVKPLPPPGYEYLHYLLYTPFRYPPLKWGSRFGKTHEPSLFYGGCSYAATLAESAYYRLIHLSSMEGKPPRHSLRSEHSIFSVKYRSNSGIVLQKEPFDAYQTQLKDPKDYSITQALGSEMRAADVEVFEYASARSLQTETCVALYSPAAFFGNKPASMQQWLCEANNKGVAFKESGGKFPVYFHAEQFMVEGELPLPA